MTENTGTPKNIPMNPYSPPNSMIAKITQNAESPVESPRIFGPRILPSNCCRIRMNTRNHSALIGASIRMIKNDGMAPINGPKYGMTFVTPTITETSIALGMPSSDIPMKHRIPMIRESRIFPPIKPPNTWFASAARSRIQSAFFFGRTAYQIFLMPAQNRSLSISI